MTKKNYKFTLQFDGTDFSGWQVQAKERTVQGDIEHALGKLFPEENITLIGAGRTDAGVHALGMTANVKLPAKFDDEELCHAVNGNLNMDVQIDSVEKMPSNFHARFSADAREYEYHFVKKYSPIMRKYATHLNHSIDFSLLQKCAEQLKGEFDFTSFCKANTETENKVCIVEYAEWETVDNQLIFRIKANRFLHHMVRFLTGTMGEVARGRYTVNDFSALLFNTPSKAVVVRAPAHGLYLKKVWYN